VRALLTGGGGMLGSSIAAAWQVQRPDDELIVLTRRDVDLSNSEATRTAIAEAAPDAVIHTAAFVGGISDKLSRPLPYLTENLRLDASVLDAVVAADVPRYIYTGSAAAYPAAAANPIGESALFTGPLEPANEGYGLAKLAGITAVGYAARQTGNDYRAILPSNLYGPGDTFAPDRAHLIASTLRKTHEAKVSGAGHVDVWGDGTARREFTFAPDVAAWIVGELETVADWPLVMNVGAGDDHTIREFYELAREVVGFDGELKFDPSKPAGVARRLIDSSVARTHGWRPVTSMSAGMAECYRSFLSRSANGDLR
jgi:GDP-L-fucose synthase